ncbi:hypothetical protein DCC24_05655 [Auritidibacter sp. NML100628]|nr:hypothetical protein DCC24_05655 [Auritidibacter sp. NML100628]
MFEGEAGLTRFVVDERAGAHLEELLTVKQAIFDGLPDDDSEEAAWKAAFFHAQALMEAFVVNTFGYAELSRWAASNSAVYASVDASPKHSAFVPLERLNDQAALYDSDTTWIEHDEERAELNIRHCAIWDYREKARQRGVTLTLDAPCEYCVPATTAMITNKGLNASHELTSDEGGHGCVWTSSRTPIENPRSLPPDSQKHPSP